ncbi:hypothetical protein [Aureimonas leprariae]|uniref:Lipoprotein n=1 Tax=Plantimonas leprariae TaxID=2615207 RepID=A0A7V7PPM1_9HYPH|nr:hypothetical protein [Aureimonas leprariae]KAB0679957.1 hypothetical protein F6X38_10310 [Aureimonas leprariae]
MRQRPILSASVLLITVASLSGCVSDDSRSARADAVAVVGNQNDTDETKAERFARGEYRRGFKHDEARNIQYCQLHPADDDCIGRRF